ncbi:hypothetical protein HNQ71_004638 [Mesorhizobium sangaii]|uniref:Uncharacterized protein n=1 Tax=Mesorhizobium sangaii TaxID=505389 RepID=A0A841PMQ4_9HYPH|nr:hypothetical protein [Mesorhizobium sangaii]
MSTLGLWVIIITAIIAIIYLLSYVSITMI